MKRRTLITPTYTSDFASAGGKAFWKQIIPQKVVNYTTKSGKAASIDFSEEFINKLIADFSAKSDVTPFMLADKDNAHTMDPERYRGDITELRLAQDGEQPGLYGKVVFSSNKMAKAVDISGGKLPVSARIRVEGDSPTLIHVLGTLDPQVPGMEKWQPADLSAYTDENVLDLSNSEYVEGKEMAKKPEVPDINAVTDKDIDAMSDEELDAFLAEYAPEFASLSDEELENLSDEDEDDEDDDDEDADDNDGARELAGAGAELSKKARRDIELANSAAASANARANEAMRRMADAEWREYRNTALSNGVPPHVLDLAEPVLNRPDDMVIDLSNTDDDDINLSEIVRNLVDGYKGTVDVDVELGHNGNFNQGSGEDPDQALLDAWDKF